MFAAALAPATSIAADAAISPDHLRISDFYRLQSKQKVLCGMHVHASKQEAVGPAMEWDIAISVLTDGKTKVAGVSAGSFVSSNSNRSARPAITRLVFSINGQAPEIPVQIFGAPNSDNAIQGQIREADAERLFDALDANTAVSAGISYDGGTADTLLLQGRASGAGIAPAGKAPMKACLSEMQPATGEPTKISETGHGNDY